MCTTCGCGSDKVTIDAHTHHHHDNDRIIKIEQDILSKNKHYAEHNREKLAKSNTLTLNLVSSPGAGKTTLLTSTITALNTIATCAVIEGDQQTSNDAKRIQATGAQAIQINTGKGCHLDAHMVGHAMQSINLDKTDILFIENVGNLVCPAAFDLGEAHKVVIFSPTEGEDKPLKYPDMFYAADLMLVNKVDLLEHLDFELDKSLEYAKRVNPKIEIIQVSAKTGVGMNEWIKWLQDRVTSNTQQPQEYAK